MARFCLNKQYVQKFREGLIAGNKGGELNPEKLNKLSSPQRRELLAKYVGKENAQQVNALFESKLLLKNQKAGYITWAKKVSGISPEVRRDLISKIERLDKVLDPESEKFFLEDLASTKLGFGIKEDEARRIFELSKALTEAKAKMKPDFTFNNKSDAIQVGASREALESYVRSLKPVKKDSFVNPLKGQGVLGKAGGVATDAKVIVKFIAQNTRTFVASFDNSLWGNQGIRTALDYRYSKIWAKNFAKSFIDIAKVLTAKPTLKELKFGGIKKGDEVLSATRAEIYSRKNSLNGRYETSTPETSKLDLGGIEEEIPTSLPSRIPVLGRVFKAAEVAYEAGAMRLRADIADKMYDMAEKRGVDMSDKFEIGSRNVVANSITGRGRLTNVPDIINDAVFSVRFTKSQLDFLTFNALDKISLTARGEAAHNILSVLGSTAVILGISKALDPNSTDLDQRSSKFGKIEKNGITIINLMPGYGSMLTLAFRIAKQSTKTKAGEVKEFSSGQEEGAEGKSTFGTPDGMDVLWDFTENKFSPIASIIRDLIRQRTFEGEKPTVKTTLRDSFVSISLDSSKKILADQTGDALLKVLAVGLSILGTGATGNQDPNVKSGVIPEGKRLTERNFIDSVNVYAEALGTDPETAFNRIFTGQKIVKTENGAIIVERMSLYDSQAIKKKYGKNTKEAKLDHTIPLVLGGSNDPSNLKIVTTAEHQSYTKVEVALGKALKKKKISKKDAQRLIKEFKAISNGTERKKFGEELIEKYK